jgi:hypothetical protein
MRGSLFPSRAVLISWRSEMWPQLVQGSVPMGLSPLPGSLGAFPGNGCWAVDGAARVGIPAVPKTRPARLRHGEAAPTFL